MSLLNVVNCCNVAQKGRIFDMSPAGKMRRSLIYLDSCAVCGRPRALIKNVEYSGQIKTVVNRTGSKAVELLEKYRGKEIGFYKVQNGSRYNMGWFWFDGLIDDWVRDFNNTKIFKLNAIKY